MIKMDIHDDELTKFEAEGPTSLRSQMIKAPSKPTYGSGSAQTTDTRDLQKTGTRCIKEQDRLIPDDRQDGGLAAIDTCDPLL
jgi:hypothetical protein